MDDLIAVTLICLGIAVVIRWFLISVKAGIIFEKIVFNNDDNHGLECWLMGAGFAVRNFFVFRYPFNPFAAFFRGAQWNWARLEAMEAEYKKKRGW